MQTLIVEPLYPELLANRHALRVDFDLQVIDASYLCSQPAVDGIVKDEGVPFSLAEALTSSGKP